MYEETSVSAIARLSADTVLTFLTTFIYDLYELA